MKEIIDGKIYDTEKARLIGSGDNMMSGADSVTDLNYWAADLYKTKKGRYFLAGKGGPMTMFAQPCGQNGSSGGSGIIPKCPNGALSWAEDYLKNEIIEEEFSALLQEA